MQGSKQGKAGVEAMEKSYLHASSLTAQHKKEMEKYSALNISLKNTVAEATKALEEAKQAVTAAQSNKSAKDQSWKQAQKKQVTMTTKDQAKNLVSSSENLLTQAMKRSRHPHRGCPSKIKCTNLEEVFPVGKLNPSIIQDTGIRPLRV